MYVRYSHRPSSATCSHRVPFTPCLYLNFAICLTCNIFGPGAIWLRSYSTVQYSGAAGFCDGLSHHGVARSGAWRIICCCLSLLAVCPGEGCAAPRKGTKIVEASERWMDERMRLGRGDFACIRGHRHAAYLCLNMLLSVVIVILISAPIFSDLRPRANTTSTTGPVQPLRVSSGFRFF